LIDPGVYRAICRMDSNLMRVSIVSIGLNRPTGLFLKKEDIHKTFKTVIAKAFGMKLRLAKKLLLIFWFDCVELLFGLR